jgi:hypothetical protein
MDRILWQTGYSYLDSNLFLSSLKINLVNITADQNYQSPNFVENKNTNSTDPSFINSVKEYWSELLDDPNEEVRSWSNDFILYQFYTTGENGGPHAVKIGEDVRKDLNYYKFTEDKLNEIKNYSDGVIDKQSAIENIMKNRWYDDDLVPVVSTTKSIITNEGPVSSSFFGIPSPYTHKGGLYDILFINEDAGRPIGRNIEGQHMYNPFVKVRSESLTGTNYILYKLIGLVPHETRKNASLPVYSAISKLGLKESGKYIYEFNKENSIVPSNNLYLKGPKEVNPRLIYDYVMYYNSVRPSAKLGNDSYKYMLSKMEHFSAISDLDPVTKSIYDEDLYFDYAPMDTYQEKESLKEYVDKYVSSTNPSEFSEEYLRDMYESQGYDKYQIDAAIYRTAKSMNTMLSLESNRYDLTTPIDGTNTNVQLQEESSRESLKTRLEGIMDDIIKSNPTASIYFEENDNMDGNEISELEDNSSSKDKSVEQLWEDNKDKIIASHPDATINDLIQINNEFGIKEVEDYIAKCF